MHVSDEEERLAPLPPLRFTHRSLLCLRATSFALFLGFTALLAHTCATDGSPFRSALLTPWMVTTLWDFYLVLLPLLLLVLLRNRASLAQGACACVFLCCLGSSATWLYLFSVFLGLRAGDPVTRLFNL